MSLRDKLSREPPPILYKYRCWSDPNHRRLLTCNEAFFSSASRFNDPFDCRIPIRYDLMTDEEIRQKCLQQAQMDRPGASEEELNRIAREVEKRSHFRDPDAIIDVQKKWQNVVFSEFGVFSLSEDYVNILMWSHYADCHEGFCVGFDRQSLELEMGRLKDRGMKTHGFPVIYEEEYPTILPDNTDNLDEMKRMLLTKSKLWEYEKEWRVLLLSKTNQAVTLDDGVFAEVVLGCSMAEQDKKEIIEVVRNKNRPIRVYQAKRKEREFGLDLERLSY